MICAECQRAERRQVTRTSVAPRRTAYTPSRSQSISLPDNINDIRDARNALSLVKRWMKREGFDRLDDVQVQFGTASQLAGSDGVNAAARAFSESGTILCQAGYDATWFVGCLAHESGHIWLYRVGVPYAADARGLSWRDEGFCELIMYRLMIEMGTPESLEQAQWMLDNPSYYYGSGFRAVLKAAERVGFKKYVAQVKSSRRIVA